MDEPVATTPVRAPWGVAALLLATSDALSARFGAVAVRGEISGFSRAASGHCYFSLKDADGAPALLRCAMFRRAAGLLDFAAAEGQQVELRGRLGVYDARGELQMVVESMQRLGAGTLFEEFLRRRDRLAALGYFEASRKRPVLGHPRALGLITSLGAAALHDVLSALRRRAPQVAVVIYPSAVQGAEAPAALISALQLANARAEVDTLLLVRGGGALEDLWAFNDERLVRAVAASAIPVVCGVGHETDVTLCDMVADLRAPTPTAAAELAAPAQADLLQALQSRATALHRASSRQLQQRIQTLDHLAGRLGRPALALGQQMQQLGQLQQRLQRALVRHSARQAMSQLQTAQRLRRALQTRLSQEQMRLRAAQDRLQAHDPRQVLRRGYAWVETATGEPVVSVLSLHSGQAVQAVWLDGRAQLQVQQVQATQADSN